MDKETLSHYGWIVVLILILSVMIALATPFGQFVANGIKSTYTGFGEVNDNALGIFGQTIKGPAEVKYYQPYRAEFEYGTIEFVFHKDGTVDIYQYETGRNAYGEIAPAGTAAYKDGIVEFDGIEFKISDDGTVLSAESPSGEKVALTLIPTPIKPLYMNTEYVMQDGPDFKVTVLFREDGSAILNVFYMGENVQSNETPAGEFKYFDQHFEDHHYDEEDGQTYITRYAIYPDGSKIIIGSDVFVVNCMHPNTEIKNNNKYYTGDKVCSDCGAIIEKGNYIGEELFGLYEDGAIELFNEQGIEAIKDMQIMSWKQMIESGILSVDDGVLNHDCEYIEPNPMSRAFAVNNDLEGDLIIHPDSNIHTIADSAFSSCGSLTGILMPETVHTIGEHAFDYAVSLDNINVTEKITAIGAYAFEGTNISEFIWPSTITIIPEEVFSSSDIKYIYIPNTVTKIEEGAFEYSNLEQVEFEKNSRLTTIESDAFKRSNLKYIDLPSSVTTMGSYVFGRCTDLTKLIINSTELTIGASLVDESYSKLTTIGDIGSGMNIECRPEVFFHVLTQAYPGVMTTISIPKSGQEALINEYGLQKAYDLTDLYIPNNIKRIQAGALSNKNGVTIHYDGTMAEWNAIVKEYNWNNNSVFAGIVCKDGTIS